MRHQARLRLRDFSGKWVGMWPGLQGLEFIENWHYLGLIRTHPARRSFGRVWKIMRHMPQLDTQDREENNRHKAGPENLNNLYGCSVETISLWWKSCLHIPQAQVLKKLLMISPFSMKEAWTSRLSNQGTQLPKMLSYLAVPSGRYSRNSLT